MYLLDRQIKTVISFKGDFTSDTFIKDLQQSIKRYCNGLEVSDSLIDLERKNNDREFKIQACDFIDNGNGKEVYIIKVYNERYIGF